MLFEQVLSLRLPPTGCGNLRRPLSKRCWFPAWLWLALVSPCLWAQESPVTAPASPAAIAPEVAPLTSPLSEADKRAESRQKTASPVEEPVGLLRKVQDRLDKLDAWVGTYLADPIQAVLFYDFGTGKWLGPTKSIPAVILWLFAFGVYLTIKMGFISFRGFGHSVAITLGYRDSHSTQGEVSHFQALCSAISGTVGLGNIGGVAVAVSVGGPGAVFWMIVCGILGMSTKFSECTLGMLYRQRLVDGTYSGGPMVYLRDGLAELGWKWLGQTLSVLVAVFCIFASFGGGCTFQVSQSMGAVQELIPLFKDYPFLYGLLLAVLTAVVILGGVRSIAAAAEKIVPLMCGLYCFMAIYVLIARWTLLDDAFWLILRGAFFPDAVYGGFLGAMVQGIRRASFSNEAGIGSSPIVHSAAKSNEPVSEGLVALLEPFIDTVVVCTITGLIIVVTGAYNNPAYEAIRAEANGATLTFRALAEVSPLLSKALAAVVFLFAFSTMISWSYYGERCAVHLFGPAATVPFRWVFVCIAFLGSVVAPTNILNLSDALLFAMAVPNLLGVFLLSNKIKQELDAYLARFRAGTLQ